MSSISQHLNLRQSQNLVMTPQLQQAIKLLQLNNVELAEFVEEELAENPLLEKVEAEDSGAGEDQASEEKEATDEMQDEFDESWTGNEAETSSQNDFDPGSSMANVGAGGNSSFDNLDRSFENSISRPKTLRDHVLEQLHLTFDDSRDRLIGALLAEQLDESGYIRQNLPELTERLGCSEERVSRLMGRMRQFDPTGIFAYDLADCLALQLEEKGTLDQPMRLLLENLELLAAHDHKKLMVVCGVNETYLEDMIGEIRALNPKPAGEFDHLVVQTVVPDVLMKALPKTLGGGWRVELNSETLPKVLINHDYYTEVAKKTKDKKDKEYLSTHLNSASWLVKAMDQRAKTILKAASEIIEHQEAFFLYGVEFLKPLTLKEIASKIDMHESTVSRVTNNKYIGTPRGVLELKYFFSTALMGTDGISHSSEAIKARLQSLVDEETAHNVLSDDKLVDILQQEGIDIARRTVAKYREALRIPSSVQRRRLKKVRD